MIARIVAAMTATMLEEKRKKLEQKKKKEEALKKKRSTHRNTSRGIGRYMGNNSLDVLKIDE